MAKNSHSPKYIEVKNVIKNKIMNRELSGKLPGERILAENFGYSYMTIRNAVNELVKEGFLYRIDRKGTYVSNPGKKITETGNIGFFLPEKIAGGIYGPYYSHVFHWIEKEARDLNLTVMYFSSLDHLSPARLKKKIDGMIVAYFPEMKNEIIEYARYFPVTCIDNVCEHPGIPSVVFDNLNGTYSAVSYIAGLGINRIGYITGLLDSDIGKNRLKGYRNAVRDCGLDNDPGLVFEGDYDFKKGIAGAKQLLSLPKPPGAIVCANDNMAFGVMRAAASLAIKVPDELNVIGFDDIEPASHMTPPLTTIHAPLNILMKVSVKNLLDIFSGQSIEDQVKIIPTQLLIRGSTLKI